MTKTPISTGKVLDFLDFRQYSDTIIETGSGRLAGVHLYLGAGYKDIRSVEACEGYHKENIIELTQKFGYSEAVTPDDFYFKSNSHEVRLYFGMSQDRMNEMLKDLNKPLVFFLDAHPSGPNSAGHEDYLAKGNDSAYAQDNVITAELKTILAHRKDHIILIDDQNGLNDENKKYMSTILAANSNYEFYFYDEKRGNTLYTNKCLVCIPENK